MHNHVQKKKKKTNYRRARLSAFQYIANCVRVTALSTTERRGCCQCALLSQSNAINSQLNKTRLVFFPARLSGGDGLFKRPRHVASEPLLEVSIRNPSFVPVLSHVLYVFRCRERHPCAHTIIYSFIITSRMSGHSMHAGQADFLHYTCLMMLFFLFSPPMSKHQLLNKCLRRTPAYIPSFRPIDQAAAEQCAAFAHSGLMLM